MRHFPLRKCILTIPALSLLYLFHTFTRQATSEFGELQSSVCTVLSESQNNIFILELALDYPSSIALMAIESAARKNPTYCVTLVYIPLERNPGSRDVFLKHDHEEAFELLAAVYGNVRRLDAISLDQVTRGTPIDALLRTEAFSRLQHKWYLAEQGSDIARYALLYKYGGIYIDSDTIVLDDLNVTDNYIMTNGHENARRPVPMSCFMKFSKGSEFLRRVMDRCVRIEESNYNSLMGALQSEVRRVCRLREGRVDDVFYRCAGGLVSVMKPGYGISHVMNERLLEPFNQTTEQTLARIPSRIAHMSYTYVGMSGLGVDLVDSGRAVAELFRRNCPVLGAHFTQLIL